MAFVNVNTKVKLVLTNYGKKKLILDGDLGIKYFGFSDEGVNYQLDVEPEIITDIQGSSDDTLYNSNGQSPIIYKK
jgi:hypothetical protein